MTERNLRRFHGTLGAALAVFLFVQAGTGTFLAFTEFIGRGRHPHDDHETGAEHQDPGGAVPDEDGSLLQVVHHYGGGPVQALRVLVGLGTLVMIVSGVTIFVIARGRQRRSTRGGEDTARGGGTGPDP